MRTYKNWIRNIKKNRKNHCVRNTFHEGVGRPMKHHICFILPCCFSGNKILVDNFCPKTFRVDFTNDPRPKETWRFVGCLVCFVPTKGFATCSSETAEEAIKVLKHTWLGFVAKLGCSFPWENRMNNTPWCGSFFLEFVAHPRVHGLHHRSANEIFPNHLARSFFCVWGETGKTQQIVKHYSVVFLKPLFNMHLHGSRGCKAMHGMGMLCSPVVRISWIHSRSWVNSMVNWSLVLVFNQKVLRELFR